MVAGDTIRFGVGSADALHSSIWRMWTHRNDVYLAARHSAQMVKVSLHSSGDWRVAYVDASQVNDPELPTGSRVLHKWRRPPEFASGWTQCLHIMIPSCSVRQRFRADDTDKNVKNVDWVLPAKLGEKVTFTVLISAPRVPEEAWQTVCRPGDATLGSVALDNDGRVWLMIGWEPMTDPEAKYAKGFIDTMRIDYESDPGCVFANVLAVVQEQPCPILLDLALGEEHVFVRGRPRP